MKTLAIILGVALSACSDGGKSTGTAEAKVETRPPVKAQTEAPRVEKRAPPPKVARTAGGHGGATAGTKKHIEWTDAIAWRGWADGLAAAKAEKKGLCLVVYANWCPRCKELAPQFGRPDVRALAKNLVMVRQDNDERPAWLTERFGRFGGYVPRVFFLRSDGTVREDLTSGNSRYPYFYTPAGIERLKESMRKAAEPG